MEPDPAPELLADARRARLHAMRPQEATVNRPSCAHCGQPVDRMRDSRGIVVAYPCGDWHTPDQARAIVNAWRATQPPEDR